MDETSKLTLTKSSDEITKEIVWAMSILLSFFYEGANFKTMYILTHHNDTFSSCVSKQ